MGSRTPTPFGSEDDWTSSDDTTDDDLMEIYESSSPDTDEWSSDDAEIEGLLETMSRGNMHGTPSDDEFYSLPETTREEMAGISLTMDMLEGAYQSSMVVIEKQGIHCGLGVLRELPRLVVLDITGNLVTSLSELRSDTLESLYADNNPIRFLGISSPDSLPSLRYISLCSTQIFNVFIALRSLRCLKELQYLRFGNERRAVKLDYVTVSYVRMPSEIYAPTSYKFFEYHERALILSETPIRAKSYYFDFFVYALPNLIELDEVPISDDIREVARRNIEMNFISHYIQRRLPSLPMTALNDEILPRLPDQKNRRLVVDDSLDFSVQKRVRAILPQYRPRQFEFNPTVEDIAVFGTITGSFVLLNSTRGVELGSEKLYDEPILGISWMQKNPTFAFVGNSNGEILLIDTNIMAEKPVGEDGKVITSAVANFPICPELTSVNVNLNDDRLIASGYAKSVPLYDVETRRRLGFFENIHGEHINVSKFKSMDAHVFATSSFDGTCKMWDTRLPFTQDPIFEIVARTKLVTLAFTDDDMYLLTSGVDNILQLFDVRTGKFLRRMKSPQLHTKHNYTRGYFMNSSEVVVSGSCKDSNVYLFDTATGNLIGEVEMDPRPYTSAFGDIYVQSLRGDPFHRNRICALLSNTLSSFGGYSYLFRLHSVELM